MLKDTGRCSTAKAELEPIKFTNLMLSLSDAVIPDSRSIRLHATKQRYVPQNQFWFFNGNHEVKMKLGEVEFNPKVHWSPRLYVELDETQGVSVTSFMLSRDLG
jgi:hypothetical protein